MSSCCFSHRAARTREGREGAQPERRTARRVEFTTMITSVPVGCGLGREGERLTSEEEAASCGWVRPLNPQLTVKHTAAVYCSCLELQCELANQHGQTLYEALLGARGSKRACQNTRRERPRALEGSCRLLTSTSPSSPASKTFGGCRPLYWPHSSAGAPKFPAVNTVRHSSSS